MRHRGGLIYLDGSELAAEAFATACRLSSGLMLDMVLAEKVSVRVDGGGHVRIGPTAITGREDVGSFLTSLLGNQGGIDMAVGHVNGSPGVVVRRAHRVVAVLALDFGGGYVHDVWIVVNPDKLAHWNTR